MRALSTLRRCAGLTAAVAGALATGATARVLAHRRLITRRRAPESGRTLGSLRGVSHTLVAGDGVELHAEVDEPADRRRGAHAGRAQDELTLLFVHAYALNLDSWHFQRAALRAKHRLVFFDQRSHGRSSRSSGQHSTIDYTGRDLATVIKQLVPDGRVLLVGHSMGGMTILALADRYPQLFADRVSGVALIATTAEGLTAATMGLPGLPGRVIHRLTLPLVATLARTPRLVESGRRATADIGTVITKRLAFGGPVPQEWVDFTDDMLAATPFEVVADFFPGFGSHDKLEALTRLSDVPSVVICGSSDSITPLTHSRRLGELLGPAEVVELPNAGHMVILERHPEITAAIERLVDRIADSTPHSRRGRHAADGQPVESPDSAERIEPSGPKPVAGVDPGEDPTR